MKTPNAELVTRGRIATAALVLIAAGGCFFAPLLSAEQGDDGAQLLKDARAAFKPLPKDAATEEFPVSPERVSLGRKLFFDPRISTDGTGSCVRCHQPGLYGADGLPKSLALHDKLLPRNAPTVLNSGLGFKVHWDGVFENVEEQAAKALLGPGFGNADHAEAMARLKAIPGYLELFRKAFPDEADPVTGQNWGKAIGAYERTLLTPSRFDAFLGGKLDALSAAERRGLRTFVDTGCVECHSGAGVGGTAFRKFGVVDDYWKETHTQEIDKGRFNVTKRDDDLYVFKVPSLRNVAMTAPYFHDGSVNRLPDAVGIMAKVQLGTELADDEMQAIVTFLGSLTGELPKDFANAPVLPPGGFTATPGAASPARSGE
jgi:cytochrome c peroxidase